MYRNYIEKLVEEGQIPGAVLYVSKKKDTSVFESYGTFLNEDNKKQLFYKNTIFDAASLTKVMATLPSLLLLASKKEVDLNGFVHSFLPEFKYKDITITHLLDHTSGLPADLSYQDRMQPRDVVTEILKTELDFETSTKTLYSDLGMILLGKIIEKVTDQKLDIFVKENIFIPWGLHDTTYLLPKIKKPLAASTEWYKGRYIQGDVHDEKAFQLNGISGSAGVFSTAKDIATFSSYWLYPEEQDLIPPTYLRSAIKHRQNNRGMGFEVWSGEGEPLSIGNLWPIGSFGHTGFTGTSLWISPTDELVAILLTNTIHLGRKSNIKNIRMQLHSLIYSSYISHSS